MEAWAKHITGHEQRHRGAKAKICFRSVQGTPENKAEKGK